MLMGLHVPTVEDVLSVKKIYAGRGAAEYYLAQERRGLADYYLTDGSEGPERDGAGRGRQRTAPGAVWWGGGARSLGLDTGPGSAVTREVFAPLYGEGIGTDGQPVGSRFRLPDDAADTAARRRAEVAKIKDDEERFRAEQALARSMPRPSVAAWDCTFSPVKSVSLLWASGDPDIERAVWAAHLASVDAALGYLERNSAHVRAGRNGVRTHDATGLVVARMNEYTSRDGDMQLHTHCVVFNRAKTVDDGKWRALDGRSLLAARAGAGALYARTLESELTRRLGVRWRDRPDGLREIVGVDDDLIERFSSRRRHIAAAVSDMAASYHDTYGVEPPPAVLSAMAQQATLATRRGKDDIPPHVALAEWESRARSTGRQLQDLPAQAGVTRDNPIATPPPFEPHAAEIAAVIARLTDGGRTSARRSDLLRAALDVIPVATRTSAALEDAAGLLVDAVIASNDLVELTAPMPHEGHAERCRSDGASLWERPHRRRWGLRSVLDAEAWLLDVAHNDRTAPTAQPPATRQLHGEQAAAVAAIVTGEHRIQLLVGPAGTGKTRTLRDATAAWQASGRPVVGLTVSQNAADVLADEIGTTTHNLAKWQHEIRSGTWHLPDHALLIIDEASMVDTDVLVDLVVQARRHNAKVVMVGDPAQLPAIGADGAFELLVERGTPIELAHVRRFNHEWERLASPRIRRGDPTALDEYVRHDRVHGGPRAHMERAALERWYHDRNRASVPSDVILLAATNATVHVLAQHARALLIRDGTVDADSTPARLRDDTVASRGDVVLARRNNRNLVADDGAWVRNGSFWTVQHVTTNGDATVRSHDGGTVTLPADYLAGHVELGYASTVHRAQGLTVDTCHAVVDDTATRESLYVAMTRGRNQNHLWTICDKPAPDVEAPPPQQVLAHILEHRTEPRSLHARIEHDMREVGGIAALTAIRDDAALRAMDTWLTSWSNRHGLDILTADPAWRMLVCKARELCALGHALPRLLDDATAMRPLDDARSPAAVLHWRLETLHGFAPERSNDHVLLGRCPDAAVARQAEHLLAELRAVDVEQRHDPAAAFRKSYDLPEHVDGLGPEPSLQRPDARAAWINARSVLQRERDRAEDSRPRSVAPRRQTGIATRGATRQP